jgi:hypothetical protein
MIVLEGRRDVAAIDQFAFLERTIVKSIAAQLNALVSEGLTLVVVLFHAANPAPVLRNAYGSRLSRAISQ